MPAHLITYLQNLKEKGELCDFEFITFTNGQESIIKAHSIILKQSEYFRHLSSNTITLEEGKYDECLVRSALDCIYGIKPMEFPLLPFMLEFKFYEAIGDGIEALQDVPIDNNRIIMVWLALNKFKKSESTETIECLMKLVLEKIRVIYSMNGSMEAHMNSFVKLSEGISQFTSDDFLDFFKDFTNQLSIVTISKLLINWIKQNPSERTKEAGPILIKLKPLYPKSNIPPPPPVPVSIPRSATYSVPPPPPMPVTRYNHFVPPPPPSTNLFPAMLSRLH